MNKEVAESFSHKPSGAGMIFYTPTPPEKQIKDRIKLLKESVNNKDRTTVCRMMCSVYNHWCWGGNNIVSGCTCGRGNMGCMLDRAFYCC